MTARNKLTAALLPALISLGLLLGSCVTSLHLLIEDYEDIVFRKELVGRWQIWEGGISREADASYVIVNATMDSLYHIMMVMNHTGGNGRMDTSYFSGFLVQADSLLFLNCIADTDGPHFNNVGEYTMEILKHTDFICVLIFRNNGEVLELWELEYSSDFKALLDEKKIAYMATSGRSLLLLEPTAGLKKLMVLLVKKHPEYWNKWLLLRTDDASPIATRP